MVRLIYIEENIEIDQEQPLMGFTEDLVKMLPEPQINYKLYGLEINNNQVIYLGGQRGPVDGDIQVRMSTIADFSQGKVIIQEDVEEKFDEAEIIYRATSRIGGDFGGFNLLNNNSETFAKWCLTGVLRTDQQFGLSQDALEQLTNEVIDFQEITPIFPKQLRKKAIASPTLEAAAMDYDQCSFFTYVNNYFNQREQPEEQY